MKKLLLLLPLTAALFACGQRQNTSANQEETIVVATAGDIPPFDYEQDGNLTGYDVEVLKAVDEKLDDYKIEFQKISWESIFPGVDVGRYQAAANNLSYTEERADKYLYSAPIAKNPLVLVSRKSAPIKELAEIAGKKTQDDTGTSTAKLVNDWNAEHPEQAAQLDYSGEDVSKRLLDLDNGEMDFLIFDKISVEKIVKDRGLDLNIVELDSSGNPNNYIIIAKDKADFQKAFNRAVKELYQDGSLEKLSQKFLSGNYLPDAKELE
ncbi:amino acid ABC transporter substrate-binding protein [Streptococcus panodentis]|uniref:Amino acid ABC transporter substrate-binding protein n=1 Tax=Streptococcus panodentis TaxID=1581472 RepID=A0ABS5AYX5_9STRE|nr:amino acid ABC transporter substrate-binding protein [Streptococcus panodentis]MBP2620884.1 amino acid ABC transporter substrate-binding protein [Streptococcus panodentis]